MTRKFKIGVDLSPYEANKFEATEYISEALFASSMEKVSKRMKHSLSREVWHRMIAMKGTCYILTEGELKDLVWRADNLDNILIHKERGEK